MAVSQMAECYICCETEPAPWRSACLCRDRFLHKECLEKLLQTQTSRTCPACASPFQNVVETTKRHYTFTCKSPFVGMWLLAMANTALAGSCINTVFYLVQRRHEGFVDDTGYAVLVGACIFFVLMCCIGTACWAWLLTCRYGWRCLLKPPIVETRGVEILVPEVVL